MYWPVLFTGIAATVFFIFIRIRKGGLPGAFAKSVSSFLFVLTGCVCLSINHGRPDYGLLIIPGLVCGLAGDIWLDIKHAFPDYADTCLYAGFYSFTAGHIFFCTAKYLCFEWTSAGLVTCLCSALASSLVFIISGRPLGLDFGKFREISFIYGFILMMTGFSACYAAYTTGETAWYMMSAGGILFAVSDIVLSLTYFGAGKTTPPYIIVNHVLYYAAQYIIASSILFVR
jgi:hypothetical protein